MKRISQSPLAELFMGILSGSLGITALVCPERMLNELIVIYGIAAVILGISDIAHYAGFADLTGFCPILSLSSGVLSVMFGIMLIANPNVGKWALTLLLPLWLIAHCISSLALSGLNVYRSKSEICLSAVLNTVGIIIGAVMLVSPRLSFMTLSAVSRILGVYLILLGIRKLIAAIDMWRRQ